MELPMAPSDPQTTQTRRFDPAAYLTTDEHRMAYLEAVLETKEVRFMLDACVVVARSIAVLCSRRHHCRVAVGVKRGGGCYIKAGDMVQFTVRSPGPSYTGVG